MRGARQPAIRAQPSDSQTALRKLSRHRRVKIAKAAHTTLVKADQWGRGEGVGAELRKALETAFQTFQKRSKK